MSSSTASSPDCQAAARAIAKAVSLAEFGLKERRLLTVVLEACERSAAEFGADFFYAYVPGLDYFARAARVSKGNVSMLLRHLKRSQVIEEQPKDYYSFRFPIEHWKVPLQIDMSVLQEVLQLQFQRDDLNGALRASFVDGSQIKNLPTRERGSSPLVRPDRSDRRPDEVSGELGVVVSRESAGSGTGAGGGKPVAVAAAGQGYPAPLLSASAQKLVPETGTSESGSRFGNPSPETGERPLPVRVLSAVPVSGTAPSLFLGTERTAQVCTKVSRNKLGEAASDVRGLQPCRLGQNALDENRQALFDEMEQIGFWSNDKTSKFNWLKFVREKPLDLVAELIGEVKYRMKRPDLETLRWPGKFANKTLQRWGVNF